LEIGGQASRCCSRQNNKNGVRNKIEKQLTQHKVYLLTTTALSNAIMSLELDLVSQVMYLQDGYINPGDEE
jgi:hypothetical protein